MARWKFGFDCFVAAQKTATVCHAFHIPGCIMSAMLLLWFDGFCTAARFGKWAKCKFCSHWRSDCIIEHMSRCKVLRQLGNMFLDLPEGGHKADFFALSDEPPVNLIKRSIHIYCVKRAFDALRYRKKEPVDVYKSSLYSRMVKYPSLRKYVQNV